jgi:hypothetical protein
MFKAGEAVAVVDCGRTFVSMVVLHLHRLIGLTHSQLMQLGQAGKSVVPALKVLSKMSGEPHEVFTELAGAWIEDAVSSLVVLREGQYTLELVSDVSHYCLPGVSLPCESVLMESVRRADELKQFKKIVPDDQVIVARSKEKVKPLRFGEILTNFDGYIKSLIDGNSSAQMLCWHPFCTPFRVYEALAPLVKQGEVVPIGRTLSSVIQAAEERAGTIVEKKKKRKLRAVPVFAAAGAVAVVACLLVLFRLVPVQLRLPELTQPARSRGAPASPGDVERAEQASEAEEQIAREEGEPETKPRARASKSGRRARRKRVDAEALAAQLEILLNNHDYAAVLAACRSLPESEAGKPWLLLCRMRALAGMRDYRALGQFFDKYRVNDGEYHAEHAGYLVKQKRWSEVIAAVEKASTTPVNYTSKERVQKDAGYALALARSARYEMNRDSASLSEAIWIWRWLKYEYRDDTSNKRYIEASSRLRRLSGLQKRTRDASPSGSP